MRTHLVAAAALVSLVGCGQAATSNAKSAGRGNAREGTLGRVIVYRSGVAYFERFAEVDGDSLALDVPHEKVNDFLKSLTVVDAITGEPAPVSFPSAPNDRGTIDMKIGVGKRPGPHRLRLSYVTEAPAWKPSYRVVVGKGGKVELQGWAVVDNTSGEDWKNVRLGVGASSAMSFRFDLKGLRRVDRETLQDTDLFALAPPVGGAVAANRDGPSDPATPSKSARADDARMQAQRPAASTRPPSTDPIGSSHFESASAMTVPKGTSAMVSILRTETEGEVVYLFDPDGPRGNAQFPFRTLRFRNPTDGALESGPVTVFGDGKFVGEGLAEPIAAQSIAFVPFALDRQVLVERKNAERDEIQKIVSVTNGIFGTEVRHTNKATFSLTNRMGERATVYVRHSVTSGYKLTKFPDTRSPVPGAGDASDHLTGSNLFRVDLEPNGRAEIEVEESARQFKSADVRTPNGLELVRSFLASAAVDEEGRKTDLKPGVEELLRLNADMVKLQQQISSTQEQMNAERARVEELRAQIATLRSVKTAGPLTGQLEKKLQELTVKISRSTVEVVSLQEKLMVAQVQFQSAVADVGIAGGVPAPKAKTASRTP